ITPEQIQEKNKKAGTRPADWQQRLPEAEDPRIDAPGAPASPTGVTAKRQGNQAILSWKSGGEADLLGYRIYRADETSGFTQIATIKDPAALTYTDASSASGVFGYYVTSVDVTGQESQPSAVASTSTAAGWDLPTPLPADNTGQPQLPDPMTDKPDQGGENGTDPTTTPDDGQPGLPAAPVGLKISKT
ncbi:hypothetical protein MXD63_38035, partial [Frankia sp. Cpl3]|nr:hypothetical protein [Frankia sp. Cpl3]